MHQYVLPHEEPGKHAADTWPRAVCCMIPLIRSVQSRQTYRQKADWWLHGAGDGGCGMTANGYRMSFWDDDNIPELDGGDEHCEWTKCQ